MLKLVGCLRALNHVVTLRSVMPASSVTSQFINTNRLRFYSTRDNVISSIYPPRPYVPHGLFDRAQIIQNLRLFDRFRCLRRHVKRIYNFDDNVTEYRPWRKVEDADGLYVTIPFNGVRPENLKVSVDRGTVFVQGESEKRGKAVCWFDLPDIDLPDKIYKTSDIKAEYDTDALLKLIIPKLKEEELMYNVNFKRVVDVD